MEAEAGCSNNNNSSDISNDDFNDVSNSSRWDETQHQLKISNPEDSGDEDWLLSSFVRSRLCYSWSSGESVRSDSASPLWAEEFFERAAIDDPRKGMLPCVEPPPSFSCQKQEGVSMFHNYQWNDQFSASALLGTLTQPSDINSTELLEKLLTMSERLDVDLRLCEDLIKRGIISGLNTLLNRFEFPLRSPHEDSAEDLHLTSTCSQEKILEAVAAFLRALLYRSFPCRSDDISECVTIIKQLLISNSSSVLAQACWTLCYVVYMVADDDPGVLRDSDLMKRLVSVLRDSDELDVIKCALIAIDSLVETHSQDMLDCGVLPALERTLLSSDLNTDVVVVRWVLSIIAAKNDTWRLAVMDSSLASMTTDRLHSESVTTSSEKTQSVTLASTECPVEALFDGNVLSLVIGMFDKYQDNDSVVLEALRVLNQVVAVKVNTKKYQPLWEYLERYKLSEHLIKLRTVKNVEIRQSARRLIYALTKIKRGG